MVFWIFGTVLAVYLLGYVLTVCYDRKRNRAVDADPDRTTNGRLLNDQHGATGERFRFGLYRVRWNGCEAIALHDAKLLLGLPSTLSEAIGQIQAVGGMFGYGFFGSDPFRLGWVLKRAGIRAGRVRLHQLDREGVYILSYWNKGAPWKGAHTVAVRYDGRTYQGYNPHRGIVPWELGRRFICGYYLEV